VISSWPGLRRVGRDVCGVLPWLLRLPAGHRPPRAALRPDAAGQARLLPGCWLQAACRRRPARGDRRRPGSSAASPAVLRPGRQDAGPRSGGARRAASARRHRPRPHTARARCGRRPAADAPAGSTRAFDHGLHAEPDNPCLGAGTAGRATIAETRAGHQAGRGTGPGPGHLPVRPPRDGPVHPLRTRRHPAPLRPFHHPHRRSTRPVGLYHDDRAAALDGCARTNWPTSPPASPPTPAAWISRLRHGGPRSRPRAGDNRPRLCAQRPPGARRMVDPL